MTRETELSRRDPEVEGIWSDAKAAVAAWKIVGEKLAAEIDRFSALFDKYLPHMMLMETEAATGADPRLMDILVGLEAKCAAGTDWEAPRRWRRIRRLRNCMKSHPRFAACVQRRFVAEWEDDTGLTADLASPEWWEKFKQWCQDHEALLRVMQIIISLLSLFVMFL